MPDEVHFGRPPDSQRVSIPDALGKELVKVADTVKASTERRNEIILELLKMGCSLRDISYAADLAQATVRQIGQKQGWPPPELKEARKRARDQALADRRRFER